MLNAVFPMKSSSGVRHDAAAQTAVWESLEQLLEFLQANDPAPVQMQRVLKDLRECLDADVTYFFPGLSGEPLVKEGSPSLPVDWCQQFALRTLGSSPGIDRELVRSHLPPLVDSQQHSYAPQSVAMVRVSKSNSSWLVALSFRPDRQFRAADVRIMALFRKILLNHRQQLRAREEWHASLYGAIHCLVTAIDAKDPRTTGRSERIARIAVRLGQELGMSGPAQSDLFLAGLMHDIGTIGVRDAVLHKDGELTPEELGHIREHAVLGDSILAKIPSLAHLRPGVRHHHERFDGNGYPDGLAGPAIPMVARVLAVADACDALMSLGAGRDPTSLPEIEAKISAGSESQWDPAVVQAFLECSRDLLTITQRGLGDSVARAIGHAPTGEILSSVKTVK